jgi:hypothetical protein
MKIPLLAVAVLVLAASCTSGTSGIFASLEREQKIVSLGGLSTTASVTSMAELTGVTPHLYFLTGGQNLFTKQAGTVTWNSTTVAGNSQVAAVGSVGGPGSSNSETVYAVANSTLYKTIDGSNWNVVPLTGSDFAFNLVPIRNSDGVSSTELLVVAQQNDSYSNNAGDAGSTPDNVDVYIISAAGSLSNPISIQYSVQQTFTNPNTPFEGISAPVLTAVKLTTNSYYFADETYIWYCNGTSASLVNVGGSAPNTGYQGLLYLLNTTNNAVTNTLYLSTMSINTTGGSLYSATPSGTTLNFALIPYSGGAVYVNSRPVWLTQLLYETEFNTLWIATGASTAYQGTGYIEYNPSNTDIYIPPSTTDSSNYNSSVLPTSAVGVLWADHETTTTYFLGTLSQGLWAWNGTTNTSDPTWTQQ